MGVAQIVTDNPERLNKDNIMKYFEEKPLKRADERLYEAKENGRNQVIASQAVMKSVRGQPEKSEKRDSLLGNLKAVKEAEQGKKGAEQAKPPKTHNKDTDLS